MPCWSGSTSPPRPTASGVSGRCSDGGSACSLTHWRTLPCRCCGADDPADEQWSCSFAAATSGLPASAILELDVEVPGVEPKEADQRQHLVGDPTLAA